MAQQVGAFGGVMFPEDDDGQRRGQVAPGTHSPLQQPEGTVARLLGRGEGRGGLTCPNQALATMIDLHQWARFHRF